MTGLGDEGSAVAIVHLDKENQLSGWSQRGVTGGTKSSGGPGASGEPQRKRHYQQVEGDSPSPLLGPSSPGLPSARQSRPYWRELSPQCPAHFPLGSECWSVGAHGHQRQQHGAVLARRSAGRRQHLAEQHRAGTGASLPIPAVADWPAPLVHGEGPPLPGRMGQANCCCGSREALTDAEAVLSTDVRLTRGRKRSERRLLLLQEELVIAKLQRGTTVRPQLRLALDQLWVLSGGKEAAGEEKEEEGGDEDRTSILLVWPSGSCVATFPSRALKELWVGTLLGTPEGAKRARVTPVPSSKLLKKELSRRHAWRTFSAGSLERLMEGQAEAGPKQGPPTVPSSDGGGLCHAPGEFGEEREPPASA
ncbi:uncharacterized protein ACIBXB_001329 [Morphnus guianensis]